MSFHFKLKVFLCSAHFSVTTKQTNYTSKSHTIDAMNSNAICFIRSESHGWFLRRYHQIFYDMNTNKLFTKAINTSDPWFKYNFVVLRYWLIDKWLLWQANDISVCSLHLFRVLLAQFTEKTKDQRGVVNKTLWQKQKIVFPWVVVMCDKDFFNKRFFLVLRW